MSTQLKLRRGTTAQHSTFTGAEGEATVDTTKDTLVVHDGTTPGGVPLAKEIGGTLTNPVVTGGSINNTTVGATTPSTGAFTNSSYSGTLTGGTGVVNLGAGQIYKDASGNVGIATTVPDYRLDVTSTDNATTTMAMSVQNNARSYGIGIGAYTMSNRNIGGAAVTIDYTFDIGGSAIFKTADTERMRIDSSGQLKTMVTGGSAVMNAYACRAWVNFNGTGTVAIRASGNVSSITDNGVGDYTVNFTTAMPDVDYATLGTVGLPTTAASAAVALIVDGQAGQTVSGVKVLLTAGAGSAADRELVCVAIFR